MASPTVVFITGVSRGIGHQLVKSYISRPNYTVIGSARNLASPGIEALRAVPRADGTNLVIVKIDSGSTTDAATAVGELKQAGVNHVDVVIANAAHNPPWVPADIAEAEDVIISFQANALGPLLLFKALKDLMQKSTKGPKWLSISSAVASIGLLDGGGTHNLAAYGISKAALNWFTVATHAGNKWLIAFAAHPGQVQTEPGNAAARMMGLEKAPDTPELAAERIMATLDNASREKTSGKFFHLGRGTEIPW
ncbi:hypothetical protein B0I35DRAFT_359041 [Stachybotrys elegans]|uniref:Uncharacterized protein n=1 Tax=Stachybotrys elegans TaxID=80388 RepID=A0A8K0SMZ3_9HYPO|nr:hypothetical protein B0I35DRAFT_359041 [Stachybotrys elegans]